jgi:hypothetical protein
MTPATARPASVHRPAARRRSEAATGRTTAISAVRPIAPTKKIAAALTK